MNLLELALDCKVPVNDSKYPQFVWDYILDVQLEKCKKRNFYEFVNIVFLEIDRMYEWNIPKDHPIFVFLEQLFNIFLWILLFSNRWEIEFEESYKKWTHGLKIELLKYTNHFSPKLLDIFKTFIWVREKVRTLIAKKDIFWDDAEVFLSYELDQIFESFVRDEFLYRKDLFSKYDRERLDAYCETLNDLLLNCDDFDGLLQVANEWILEFEENPSYFFYKWFSLFKKWFYQRAEIFLRQYNKDEPNDNRAIGCLSYLEFKKIMDWDLYKYQELKEKNIQSLHKNKDFSYYLILTLWLCELKLNNYKEAKKYFSEILSQNPDDNEAIECFEICIEMIRKEAKK